MVICLERDADLYMAQLRPLHSPPVSCFNKIQIGFTFLVPAHLGSPGKGAVTGVCSDIRNCCIRRRVLLQVSVAEWLAHLTAV